MPVFDALANDCWLIPERLQAMIHWERFETGGCDENTRKPTLFGNVDRW